MQPITHPITNNATVQQCIILSMNATKKAETEIHIWIWLLPRLLTTSSRTLHKSTKRMEVKREYSPNSPTDASPVDIGTHGDIESDLSLAEDEEKLDSRPMSHQQAMEQFKDALAEIVVGDQLLCDLHTEVTLEEIKSQIALEHGKAITVNVRRADNIIYPVVVVHNATVLDLKKAIHRHVILRQARDSGIRRISWRYVWRSYWLYFSGQKLTEDSKLIKDYGIGNKDELTFIKRIRSK